MSRVLEFLGLLLLILAPAHGAAFLGTGRGGQVGERMQPDVVASTLVAVEEEWKGQASVAAECAASASDARDMKKICSRAERAFNRSCSVVVGAVVQASGGNRADAKEYMDDVCGQSSLEGWHKDTCELLATTLISSMSVVDVDNREDLSVAGVCGRYWQAFVDAERTRISEERSEEAARDKDREERDKEKESAKAPDTNATSDDAKAPNTNATSDDVSAVGNEVAAVVNKEEVQEEAKTGHPQESVEATAEVAKAPAIAKAAKVAVKEAEVASNATSSA